MFTFLFLRVHCEFISIAVLYLVETSPPPDRAAHNWRSCSSFHALAHPCHTPGAGCAYSAILSGCPKCGQDACCHLRFSPSKRSSTFHVRPACQLRSSGEVWACRVQRVGIGHEDVGVSGGGMGMQSAGVGSGSSFPP